MLQRINERLSQIDEHLTTTEGNAAQTAAILQRADERARQTKGAITMRMPALTQLCTALADTQHLSRRCAYAGVRGVLSAGFASLFLAIRPAAQATLRYAGSSASPNLRAPTIPCTVRALRCST